MASLKWIVVIAAVSVAAAAAGIAVYSSQTSVSEREITGKDGGDSEVAIVSSENKSSAAVLPTPYAKEFSLLKDTMPNGILVDREGTVWTVGSKSHTLIAFDPEQQKAKSYPIPSGSDNSQFTMTWAMVEGKDGSIWFSGSGGNPLWRFDPEAEQFELVDALTAAPIQMKVDDQGRIWYTSLHQGVIGVVQKQGQGYDTKEIKVEEESFPSGVYVQNQTLWVTLSLAGKIALYDISYSESGQAVAGIAEESQFPELEELITPTDIIIRNGSTAWITEHNTSFLTKYDTETQKITRYPTALHPIHISTLPYWLEPSSDEEDDGIWFNEHRGNRISFFDLSENTLTEYEIPTRTPEMGYIANALTISTDPANADRLWFTEFTEDKIGYVDKSVPIPFDISTPDKQQLVLKQGQTAQINIDVTRDPEAELFNNTLSFNVSSSAILSGFLLNATADFSANLIDLSKVNGTQTVTLELKNQGMQKGQHTLAISATDGAVVRTIYVDLVIR